LITRLSDCCKSCICRKNSIEALRLRAKEHQALLEQRLLAAAAKTAAQVQAKS